MEAKTIKEAFNYAKTNWDVQIEKSDRKGYKWCCPDNQYDSMFTERGDEYHAGWVYFKRDKDVVEYVNKYFMKKVA